MTESKEPVVSAEKKDNETKIDITEHLLSVAQLQELIKVKVDTIKPVASPGLSPAEAAERLIKYGPNRLSPPKKVHPFIQFMLYFLQLFSIMLWVSGIVAYIIYFLDPINNSSNVYIGGILLGVCVLNNYIEFMQTQKSAALLESFMVIYS
jgi:sodium/potassium-transporting ATPase subunit alpha